MSAQICLAIGRCFRQYFERHVAPKFGIASAILGHNSKRHRWLRRSPHLRVQIASDFLLWDSGTRMKFVLAQGRESRPLKQSNKKVAVSISSR
jgi:hypothetical protein